MSDLIVIFNIYNVFNTTELDKLSFLRKGMETLTKKIENLTYLNKVLLIDILFYYILGKLLVLFYKIK